MFKLSIISALSDIFFAFVETVIGLRIILKFLDASTSAQFVMWVYQTSKPLLAPFEGMFPSPITNGRFMLEISSLFALLAYGFLGYIIQEGLDKLDEQQIPIIKKGKKQSED